MLRNSSTKAFRASAANTPARGALSRFLQAILAKEVKPGDILLVEDTDRLTRQEVLTAFDLVSGILRAGVEVVEIAPATGGEKHYTEASVNVNPMEAIGLLFNLSRGHGESARKSKMIAEAWGGKRRDAAKEPLGATCPGWLEIVERRTVTIKGKSRLVGGKYVRRQPQWSTMRSVVKDVMAGIGLPTICRRLNREQAAPLRRRTKLWQPSALRNILRGVKGRTLLGEYQP
jgi:hypothetical protein